MKRVLTLLIIPVLLIFTAYGCQNVLSDDLGSSVSENTSIQSTVSTNSSFQNESLFTVYHSVLNPGNDAFLNNNPLDKQISIDLFSALNRSEEQEVSQKYINLWSSEMASAEDIFKSLLNKDAVTAFEEAQTAWENDLDKDLTFFSETYLSVWGNGSDIGIYTGYLMLEKVRTRTLELIDRILFFDGEYTFSQT